MRFSRTLSFLALLLGAETLFAQGVKEITYDLPQRKALVQGIVDAEAKSLDALYKYIHSQTELSV